MVRRLTFVIPAAYRPLGRFSSLGALGRGAGRGAASRLGALARGAGWLLASSLGWLRGSALGSARGALLGCGARASRCGRVFAARVLFSRGALIEWDEGRDSLEGRALFLALMLSRGVPCRALFTRAWLSRVLLSRALLSRGLFALALLSLALFFAGGANARSRLLFLAVAVLLDSAGREARASLGDIAGG